MTLRKPPSQTQKTLPDQADLDKFAAGARRSENTTLKKEGKQIEFPWDAAMLRDDVVKIINIRLPEAYHLKLKYIVENIPESAHKFCFKVVTAAIDKEIKRLTGR